MSKSKSYQQLYKEKTHFSVLPGTFLRIHSGTIPVTSIGYIPYKSDIVRRQLNTFSYSLILRGNGYFMYNGTAHKVQAPCVISKWPGEKTDYGPVAGTTWEELYFTYVTPLIPELQRRNYIPSDTHGRILIWQLSPVQLLAVRNQMEQLVSALDRMQDRYGVTRIDLIMERLIFECTAQQEKAVSRDEQLVREAELLVREKDWDFKQLEKWFSDQDITLQKFRRMWNSYITQPPGKYVLSVKLDKARQLLVDTKMSVREIAAQLRFTDEFYFSRRFKKEFSLAPTQYREQYTQ